MSKSKRVNYEARSNGNIWRGYAMRQEYETPIEAAKRALVRKVSREGHRVVKFHGGNPHAFPNQYLGVLVAARQHAGGGYTVIHDDVRLWVE